MGSSSGTRLLLARAPMMTTMASGASPHGGFISLTRFTLNSQQRPEARRIIVQPSNHRMDHLHAPDDSMKEDRTSTNEPEAYIDLNKNDYFCTI